MFEVEWSGRVESGAVEWSGGVDGRMESEKEGLLKRLSSSGTPQVLRDMSMDGEDGHSALWADDRQVRRWVPPRLLLGSSA